MTELPANCLQNQDHTGTLDAEDQGIMDLLVTKQWAIKLATEAARTVLSVDQIIVARQAGGPKPPGPNAVGLRCPLQMIQVSNSFFAELG